MRKVIIALGVIFAVTSTVYADGNAFTPLNFNDTTYGKPSVQPAYSAPTTANVAAEAEAVGNGNIQNAISQLENAQVDIRNDLLNCKTKYADVDAQYKLVKSERSALKKQVKSVERRIKEIDKAKEKIRKNML